MKLEPIVDISNGNIFSFDVLSSEWHAELSNVAYFKCRVESDRLNFFQRQLEQFQKLHEQDVDYFSSMFIYVSVDLILDVDFIVNLYPFVHNFKVNLELKCGLTCFLETSLLRARTKILSAIGVDVWLGGMKVEDILAAKELIMQRGFYGIKVDSFSIEESFSNGIGFSSLLSGFSDRVIVDGLRATSCIDYAKSQGVIIFQGVYK